MKKSELRQLIKEVLSADAKKKIANELDELSSTIEGIEVSIRDASPHDDISTKYRVFADNLQREIRKFRKQYKI